MLTHRIPPAFRDGANLCRQPPAGQSRVYQVTQMRVDSVPCREATGIGHKAGSPRVTQRMLPFLVTPWINFCAPLFFQHHERYGGHDDMCDRRSVGGMVLLYCCSIEALRCQVPVQFTAVMSHFLKRSARPATYGSARARAFVAGRWWCWSWCKKAGATTILDEVVTATDCCA